VASDPFLMNVKPLWLRNKIYWKFYRGRTQKYIHLFQNCPLAFLPSVRLNLCPTDLLHEEIALTGFCELKLTRLMTKLAKKGGLLIDVGANYGYFSCLWAGYKESNRAIAFEPSPDNFFHLKKNIEVNSLSSRIKAYESAASKAQGQSAFLKVSATETGWGGLVAEGKQFDLFVPTVRLDEIEECKTHTIDVLKIDVEGAEAWVLEGAEALLKARKITHIFYEENAIRMKALNIFPDNCRQMLERYGYTVEVMDFMERHAFLK
jgi:FkbM family methyltransferase